MNDVLWMFAAVLAVVFLVTGFLKVFRFNEIKNRLDWVNDLPRPLVTLNGLFEIVAALLLVLPPLIGSYAWLAAYAAIGLAMLMFMSSVFHYFRHETDNLYLNMLIFVLAAFVGYGRLVLVPFN